MSECQEVYSQMMGIWEKECDLFGVKPIPPGLVLFEKVPDKNYLKFIESTPGLAKVMIDRIATTIALSDYASYYIDDQNIIVLNNAHRDSLPEEVVHSVVHPDNICMHANWWQYDGPYKGFGHDVEYALWWPYKETIHVSEFFVPLGYAHLGLDFAAISVEQIRRALKKDPNYKRTVAFEPGLGFAEISVEVFQQMLIRGPNYTRSLAFDFLQHLPQYAGVLLCRQYGMDARAILREHPSLPKLTGLELWDQYINPLLINGKI